MSDGELASEREQMPHQETQLGEKVGQANSELAANSEQSLPLL
jgi:hypothetical protein